MYKFLHIYKASDELIDQIENKASNTNWKYANISK